MILGILLLLGGGVFLVLAYRRLRAAQDQHSKRHCHEGEQGSTIGDIRKRPHREQAGSTCDYHTSDQSYRVRRVESWMDPRQRCIERQQPVASHREEDPHLSKQHHQHDRWHGQECRQPDELRGLAPTKLADHMCQWLASTNESR